jgi:hypothetical protein
MISADRRLDVTASLLMVVVSILPGALDIVAQQHIAIAATNSHPFTFTDYNSHTNSHPFTFIDYNSHSPISDDRYFIH